MATAWIRDAKPHGQHVSLRERASETRVILACGHLPRTWRAGLCACFASKRRRACGRRVRLCRTVHARAYGTPRRVVMASISMMCLVRNSQIAGQRTDAGPVARGLAAVFTTQRIGLSIGRPFDLPCSADGDCRRSSLEIQRRCAGLRPFVTV
ncbi:hypothetical protein GY45DRAFT_483503 [Cubamyces sp. BRFM 1775]|nr:hypothetical protein GY45DRAFT_483503 [Cubamyces sp. BRFM 1775]